MASIRILCVLLGLAVSGLAAAEAKIYDVDGRYREEVVDALNQVLTREYLNPASRATVSVLPTGQILIDASERRHAEIAQILEAIAERGVSDSPSAMLRYWVLLGEPNGGSASLPTMLEPVVNELRAAVGDLNFAIVDTASLVTMSGEESFSGSETLEIVQTLTVNGDSLNGSIFLGHEQQELKLEISMNRGDFLVLGDSMIQVDENTRGVLAFVVHWVEQD
jgi:hypothetical protein